MKRIDNRQNNLARRVCGRPRSVATGTTNKHRKKPVVTDTKRRGGAVQCKIA